MWSVGCGVLDVECWMWNVGCEMMDVECGIWNGACGTGMFSHRSQLDTDFFACGEPFYEGAFSGHARRGRSS